MAVRAEELRLSVGRTRGAIVDPSAGDLARLWRRLPHRVRLDGDARSRLVARHRDRARFRRDDRGRSATRPQLRPAARSGGAALPALGGETAGPRRAAWRDGDV